jgi:alpha-beta hydrolase superfamily lysophospholipase
MAPLSLIALAVTLGSAEAAAPTWSIPSEASAVSCYEGTFGAGPRLRRVIVESHFPDSATVHLYLRPGRSQVLLPAAGAPAASDSARFLGADGRTSLAFAPGSRAESVRLTMMSARDTARVTLRRVHGLAGAGDVAGQWTAAVGPGGVIRLDTRLAPGPCGILVGALDSPDQGQRDLPMTVGRIEGDSVVVEAGYMNLRIAMPLRGGDVRRATMVQDGVPSEIEMRRGDAAVQRRPQEPSRPYPYHEQDVRFPSRSREAPVTLAGTLTMPVSSGPHQAIVLISGSGAQDRDETVAGHRPFLVLADHLTRLGYAVLRFDDRGAGATAGGVAGGGPMQVSLDDVADDVRGALDLLRSRADIATARIGLLGHSEGAYVAQLVAAGEPSVAFMLLLGGPAARGRELLLAQRTMLTRASGESAIHVRVDSLMMARIFTVFDRRPDDARLGPMVDSTLADWLSGLSPDDRRVADAMLAPRTAAQDSSSIGLWKSRWFKRLYHHDPAPVLRKVAVPVFALVGELDLQVPAAVNVPALEAAFAGSRRSLLTLHRLPGINHMLQRATTGRMEEYMTIEETIAPEILALIEQWLAQTTPSPTLP